METRSVPELTKEARDACAAADWPLAMGIFAELVRTEPKTARHWMNLGVASGNAGDQGLARSCFARALLLEPGSSRNVNNLASRVDPAGENELHMRLIGRLLLLDPLHVRSRITSMIGCLADRHDDRALREATRAQVVRPWEIDALFFGAQSALRLGRTTLAASLLWRYLAVDPDDRRGAARDLERLGLIRSSQSLSDKYISGLFDHYAPMFERHLTGKLKYNAPQTLERLLGACLGDAEIWAERAIDLGCGTGLCGEFLRPRCIYLEGVDLAPKMVETARKRGVYDTVEVGEIVRHLKAAENKFDLILAADVTTYIGDLEPLFTSARSALQPGGRFATTFNERPNGTFAIDQSGTYTHAVDYIEEMAEKAGLQIEQLEKGSMRQEAKRPLATLFYVFRAPN